MTLLNGQLYFMHKLFENIARPDDLTKKRLIDREADPVSIAILYRSVHARQIKTAAWVDLAVSGSYFSSVLKGID